MKRLGQLKVLDKHGADQTGAALEKLAQPPSDARRTRAVQFMVQHCGYTQQRAQALFDNKNSD